jgi:DNA primase large subunit
MPVRLDVKDLAKYPFLIEAQEQVGKRAATLEAFIQSNYGRNVLHHAAARVTSAIRGGKEERMSEGTDPETDLLSYALARVLVSCIGERGVIERHARYEASRAFCSLLEEGPELRAFLTERMGMDLDADRMTVPEYVELAASLRESQWRLVNREIVDGSVVLGPGEMEELLRERIRRSLARQLPLPVPKSLCEQVAPVVGGIASSYQEQILQQFGELDESSFPPCIQSLVQAITAGTNLPHQGRFAITAFLHAVGMTAQEIVELYCRAPDFNVEKTVYQVEHITGSHGTEYTAPSCATMRTYGFCVKRDGLCEHVNHPLNYYLIQKKKKKEESRSSSSQEKTEESAPGSSKVPPNPSPED